jgi:hypothetical protein
VVLAGIEGEKRRRNVEDMAKLMRDVVMLAGLGLHELIKQ